MGCDLVITGGRGSIGGGTKKEKKNEKKNLRENTF